MFSISYFTLTARSQVSDGRNKPQSNYAPRTLGSSASPLMDKLEPDHYEVRLSAQEKKVVRLWIETGAAYPGTYAALGTGMIGSYSENQLDRSDTQWPSTKASMETITRRCGSCHTKDLALPLSASHEHIKPPWENMGPTDPRRRLARHLLYNLTRPDKSMLLLAPLAKAAGGFDSCRQRTPDGKLSTQPAAIFAGTSDTDYQTILAAISEAGNKLDIIKRFDMPGFRPRMDWVREMQRYGLLAADLNPEAPLDYYAIEREYWKSLWYVPMQ